MVLVCWCFLRGIKPLYRSNRKVTLALLAFLFVGVTTSSVLQANAGSAMRHRIMFSFMMFPIAVYGMTKPRAPKRVRFRALESKPRLMGGRG